MLSRPWARWRPTISDTRWTGCFLTPRRCQRAGWMWAFPGRSRTRNRTRAPGTLRPSRPFKGDQRDSLAREKEGKLSSPAGDGCGARRLGDRGQLAGLLHLGILGFVGRHRGALDLPARVGVAVGVIDPVLGEPCAAVHRKVCQLKLNLCSRPGQVVVMVVPE